MCMAVPSRVLAIDGEMATVEAFGQTRSVSLVLVDEPVALGDYLLVQAGGFAYERLERQAALDALRLIAELADH